MGQASLALVELPSLVMGEVALPQTNSVHNHKQTLHHVAFLKGPKNMALSGTWTMNGNEANQVTDLIVCLLPWGGILSLCVGEGYRFYLVGF